MKDLRPNARCVHCGRAIRVTDPGIGATPWLVPHRLGKAADLRGGDSPKGKCPGSLTGVDRSKFIGGAA